MPSVRLVTKKIPFVSVTPVAITLRLNGSINVTLAFVSGGEPGAKNVYSSVEWMRNAP